MAAKLCLFPLLQIKSQETVYIVAFSLKFLKFRALRRISNYLARSNAKQRETEDLVKSAYSVKTVILSLAEK